MMNEEDGGKESGWKAKRKFIRNKEKKGKEKKNS